MATYVYTAVDGNGKELKGKIQATTEDMAALELRKRDSSRLWYAPKSRIKSLSAKRINPPQK